jgi:hypothetical protein
MNNLEIIEMYLTSLSDHMEDLENKFDFDQYNECVFYIQRIKFELSKIDNKLDIHLTNIEQRLEKLLQNYEYVNLF